jgi:diguanylate cyclase (GGDEF)-like protein
MATLLGRDFSRKSPALKLVVYSLQSELSSRGSLCGALRPNEVFGRIGGEEFAVVLPGSGIEAAWVRAERIRTSFMERCRKLGKFEVHSTVSGGVATSAAPRLSLDTLLASADVALYRAKIEGRNCIKRSNDPSPDGGQPGVIRVA